MKPEPEEFSKLVQHRLGNNRFTISFGEDAFSVTLKTRRGTTACSVSVLRNGATNNLYTKLLPSVGEAYDFALSAVVGTTVGIEWLRDHAERV